MRVILSRKGFDSDYGGHPSPILPDGRLVSLPIPGILAEGNSVSYSELKLPGYGTYHNLMEELGIKFKGVDLKNACCHLDPDIYGNIIERHKDWRPLFGQTNKAQKHLENNKIGNGDLFLFFGWFRHTDYKNGKLVFEKPDLHVIFGYLQVEKPINLANESFKDWMKYHPHVNYLGLIEKQVKKNNTLYVATDRLTFNNDLPGAGVLRFNEKLILTKQGKKNRSQWELPNFFKELEISHHPNPWKNNYEYFQSVGRGQEFVIAEDERVSKWAESLISENHHSDWNQRFI